MINIIKYIKKKREVEIQQELVASKQKISELEKQNQLFLHNLKYKCIIDVF